MGPICEFSKPLLLTELLLSCFCAFFRRKHYFAGCLSVCLAGLHSVRRRDVTGGRKKGEPCGM